MSAALHGIVTVLNTPFAEDDSIDTAGLQKNVANALQAGVAGFLVPALASEVDQLTYEEKQELVGSVVAQSRGRAVVIGGASAASQRERLALARNFLELGCDGILMQWNADVDSKSMERNMAEIVELGPKFLMLQDWDPIGSGIPLATLVGLFERVDRFDWLKIEVQDAGPKYSEVLAALSGKLRVAGGWAVTRMIDGLDRGVHVFMPTAMHRIYVEIYQRHASGDREGAKRLFARIAPVLAFSNQRLDISIRFFKRLLHAQGVYATPDVRVGGTAFTSDQERLADRLIATVTEIEAELP